MLDPIKKDLDLLITRLEKPGSDYTKWDLKTIIDQTGYLYQLSLQDVTRLQNTPMGGS